MELPSKLRCRVRCHVTAHVTSATTMQLYKHLRFLKKKGKIKEPI